ncbi:MAG: type II secretion system protein [Pedosphaera sp.]|nr:type II secretion system protein [Pedosphaera sp.]
MKISGTLAMNAQDMTSIGSIGSIAPATALGSQQSTVRSLEVAFTLIELLAVIAIMGVLAGMLVGLAPVAGAKMRESRIRAELQQIVAAIEEYKAKYGFYPPDGVATAGSQKGYARPELNPLYYELSGMLVIQPFDPAGYFRSIDGDQKLTSVQLSTHFGRTGIANSSPDKRRILNQSFKPSQHADLYKNAPGQPPIELLVVPQPWPASAVANAPLAGITGANLLLNPWRYVSSNPTNNPASYDLWAEFWRGRQKITIGNWKQ